MPVELIGKVYKTMIRLRSESYDDVEGAVLQRRIGS